MVDVIADRATNYRNSLMKSGGHWQKPILYHPLRCNSVVFFIPSEHHVCFFLFFADTGSKSEVSISFDLDLEREETVKEL